MQTQQIQNINLSFDDAIIKGIPDAHIRCIKNGYMYITGFSSGAYSYYQRVYIDNLNATRREYGSYDSNGGNWNYHCLRSVPLTYDKVLIWTDLVNGVGTLYYTEAYRNNSFTYSALIELLPDCQSEYNGGIGSDWGEDYQKMRFKTVELSGTTYYKVILRDNGIPEIVKESEYIAGEQKVIILQPINR